MIVRIFSWDQPKNVSNSLERKFMAGDWVVVDHDWGMMLAKVLISDKNIENEEISGRVVRKMEQQDKDMFEANKSKEEDIFLAAKEEARERGLEMKIVEARLSLDASSSVIAFTAEGRIDFRDLVRSLSVRFGKSIRFQQIGSRDEARRCGGYGICGRELCCRKFPGSLKSITTEMARCQLISRRGSDRISGLCGRLMCCLAFEAEQYQAALEDLPVRGENVLVEGKRGTIFDVLAMEGKIKVQLEDGNIVTVSPEKTEKISLKKDR